jgi:hypothetical protein
MGSISRLSGDPSRVPLVAGPGAARLLDRWRRLLIDLRARAPVPAPSADRRSDDDEVFALQCAELEARAQFNEAMEVWACRT